MKHDIAFLHTSDVHIEPFQNLMAELAPKLKARHIVDESLLIAARREGITGRIKNEIDTRMRECAATGAAVVACTCSTIGGSAENSGYGSDAGQRFVSMRIDRAMADQAVRAGARILIVAALQSTLEPTQLLVLDSAEKIGKTPEVALLYVTEAWPLFESAEFDAYRNLIARDIEASWLDYDVIVLAQASMAGARKLCGGVVIPILSSPETGVRAAIDAVAKAH